MVKIEMSRTNSNRKDTENKFHITVGTHPSGDLSLEQEIRLVKAALLYADRVKLYSLKSSGLRMMQRIGDMPIIYKINLLEKVTPYVSSHDDAEKLLVFFSDYTKFLLKKHLNRKDLIIKLSIQKILDEQWANVVSKKIDDLAKESQIDVINRAVKSGILELHTFKGTETLENAVEFIVDCIALASKSPLGLRQSEKSSRDDQMISEFVEQISNAVANNSTYPLFDDETGTLVKLGIQAKVINISDQGKSRGKQVGLAGHLLERLPLFEEATLDEVFDIRSGLDKHLTRFRKAMIQFSEAISNAQWDKDFPADAEQVFYRDVKPSVLDIEEEVKSNKYMLSLLQKFVEKPAVLPVGSIFSIVMSNLSHLPEGIALTLGISISSAALIFDAYNEWKQKNRVIEQNHLYFYYQAAKRLSGVNSA